MRSVLRKNRDRCVGAGALFAAAVIWQLAFKVPAGELLPVPSQLVSLTAAEGHRLLVDDATSTDYQSLDAFRTRGFVLVRDRSSTSRPTPAH